jgi:Uma2 family endonuclease
MPFSAVTERRPATPADLEALPEGIKGELIDGVLYAQARPRAAHQDALGALHTDLDGPFRRGRGGPGGWRILVEPGLHAEGAPEYSPEIAGWRRERLPELPEGRIAVVPDWICEILSPSNRRYDLVTKRRFYARIGVSYRWYVDLEAGTLAVSRLVDSQWLELGVWGAGEKVRADPFAAVELDVAAWVQPELPK